MLDFESPSYLENFLFPPPSIINLYYIIGLVEEGEHLGQILHSDVYFEYVHNAGNKPLKMSQITLILAAIFNLAAMLDLRTHVPCVLEFKKI